jgi:hypothetical protein
MALYSLLVLVFGIASFQVSGQSLNTQVAFLAFFSKKKFKFQARYFALNG